MIDRGENNNDVTNLYLNNGVLKESRTEIDGGTVTTFYNYHKWDGLVQSKITSDGTTDGHKAKGVLEVDYDENNNAVARTDFTGKRRSEYSLNVDGQVAVRTEYNLNQHKGDLADLDGTTLDIKNDIRQKDKKEYSKTQNYVYFGGNLIGEAGDFDIAPQDYAGKNAKASTDGEYTTGIKANFQPVSNSVDPYKGSTGYFTNEGDTLESVSLQLYGDASLWHILAEANGLQGSEKLPKGTYLTVPEAVYAVANKAFIYHLDADAIGEISAPTLTDFSITRSDQVQERQTQTIGIGIQIVALVAGYFGGPIAYAAVKQELNKQAGFQNGYNLRDFAVDAATYAITSEIVGGAGEAAGVGEVIARGAAAATINAGIRGAVYEYDKQRGVSKANRGGSAFSFQDLGVDITATAVTAGFAKELKVTDVNNQLVNAFTRSAKNIVVKDLIARAVYDDYDDYLEKQGGSFLFRTLQGGLTNYTNTALATYSPQEQPEPGEKDLYDRATEFLFGAEDMVTQNNQLAALQRENSQPSGPPEGAPNLSDMQASAYGIEPGAIVDVGAGNILGGIDGVSFNENMRARLGVETVGLSDLDALPITTDSPDSLAYLEASNRLSVAGSDQTSHTDAQYLEDAIASGDVLVRGFNETEAVITNEALSYGDVSSKEYEIDYADYESINQATYELDLFDFDVANGFAESKEINPFTQLFGDISSSLTEYGNYASVSFDEAVTATNEKLGEFANGISDNQEGLNAFYDGVKVEASNDGNLPKYLAASFGQSFGNFGYNIVGFGANLLGDQTRAAEQWDDFGEYSLETSEGTNALELEGGIGVNFFGNQVSIGLSFGADNQGRVDIALGFNHEPNTDVLGFEFLAGANVAKAWGVDSVNDLVSGHSAAYDGFVSGQYVAGAEASYGQGLLFTDKGDVPFAQVGIAVTIEDPVESPVWGGVGVDYEYAISSSQFLTAEERGYDWGWAGKAIYGLVNLTYGNGIDAVASNRNNGVTVPSNRENR